MQLANNRDFEAFTISDWSESPQYDPIGPVPAWDDSVRAAWSKDLKEPSDFDYPIYELVMWRAEYGLEMILAFRRRLIVAEVPRSEYEMCSENT